MKKIIDLDSSIALKKSEEANDEIAVTRVKMFKNCTTHQKNKIISEQHLDEVLPWHFENGNSYHCVSFGDVDSLSYLRFILKQQKLKYCLISTWCMSVEDAKEIESWVNDGLVEHIDFYVGEIFKGGYRGCYSLLCEIVRNNCGRVAIFRNHSKVMLGFGEKFDFVIESSANVNTNPRCEQTCITIDEELAKFYKDFYDGINSFGNDFSDWRKFEI